MEEEKIKNYLVNNSKLRLANPSFHFADGAFYGVIQAIFSWFENNGLFEF
jgi:hypothetical protein